MNLLSRPGCGSGPGDGVRKGGVLKDHVGGALGQHEDPDDKEISRDARKGRGIDHAKPLEPVDAQPGIKDAAGGFRAHGGGAAGVMPPGVGTDIVAQGLVRTAVAARLFLFGDKVLDGIGDPGWRASQMQRHFQRIERCRYRFFLWRWLWRLTGLNPTGHGWTGWQTTERAIPMRAVLDFPLRLMLLRSVGAASDVETGAGARWETTSIDPNDRRWWNRGIAGVRVAPLGTRHHARHGARERLLDVRARHPDRLELRLHARVLRIEFQNRRAIGVVVATPDGPMLIRAGREVILAGGAFGTPKLLMLSGIGDAAHRVSDDPQGDGLVRPARRQRHEVPGLLAAGEQHAPLGVGAHPSDDRDQ